MKHHRRDAFNDWWSLPENEGNRFTPSEVWDAACEWMKEELQWRIEHCIEKADL
jgi:hypothetical protein